jgi:hypothetical protein
MLPKAPPLAGFSFWSAMDRVPKTFKVFRQNSLKEFCCPRGVSWPFHISATDANEATKQATML